MHHAHELQGFAKLVFPPFRVHLPDDNVQRCPNDAITCAFSRYLIHKLCGCRKVLCFQLVRDITGKQFIGALEESLRPRLQGQCSPEVDRLKSTFLHTSLRKDGFFVMSVRGGLPLPAAAAPDQNSHPVLRGCSLLSRVHSCPRVYRHYIPPVAVSLSLSWELYAGTGSISFSICDAVDADHAEPALTLNNALFARAVLDIYLGRQPLVPDARRKWAMAAAPLLSSQ